MNAYKRVMVMIAVAILGIFLNDSHSFAIVQDKETDGAMVGSNAAPNGTYYEKKGKTEEHLTILQLWGILCLY